MEYYCEPVEMSDVERTKVLVECIIYEEIVDREEPQLWMFVFGRRGIEGAQVQAV